MAISTHDGTPVAVIDGKGGILTTEDLLPFIGSSRVRMTNAQLISIEDIDLSPTALNIDGTSNVILSNVTWNNFRVNDNLEIDNVGKVTLQNLRYTNGQVGGITTDSVIEITNALEVSINNIIIDSIDPFAGKSKTDLNLVLLQSIQTITIQNSIVTNFNLSYAEQDTHQVAFNISDANSLTFKNNTLANFTTNENTTFEVTALKAENVQNISITDITIQNWTANFAYLYGFDTNSEIATISENKFIQAKAKSIDPINAFVTQKAMVNQNKISHLQFMTNEPGYIQSEAITVLATDQGQSEITISENQITNVSILEGSGELELSGILAIADNSQISIQNNSITINDLGNQFGRSFYGLKIFSNANTTIKNETIKIMSGHGATGILVASENTKIQNSNIKSIGSTRAIGILLVGNRNPKPAYAEITSTTINATGMNAKAIEIEFPLNGTIEINNSNITSNNVAINIFVENNATININNNSISAQIMITIADESGKISLKCNNNTFNNKKINQCLIGEYTFIRNIPVKKENVPIIYTITTIIVISITIIAWRRRRKLNTE